MSEITTDPTGSPETTGSTASESTPPETTRADRIEVNQGGMYAAEAGTISIMQGGISTATADVRAGAAGHGRDAAEALGRARGQ